MLNSSNWMRDFQNYLHRQTTTDIESEVRQKGKEQTSIGELAKRVLTRLVTFRGPGLSSFYESKGRAEITKKNAAYLDTQGRQGNPRVQRVASQLLQTVPDDVVIDDQDLVVAEYLLLKEELKSLLDDPDSWIAPYLIESDLGEAFEVIDHPGNHPLTQKLSDLDSLYRIASNQSLRPEEFQVLLNTVLDGRPLKSLSADDVQTVKDLLGTYLARSPRLPVHQFQSLFKTYCGEKSPREIRSREVKNFALLYKAFHDTSYRMSSYDFLPEFEKLLKNSSPLHERPENKILVLCRLTDIWSHYETPLSFAQLDELLQLSEEIHLYSDLPCHALMSNEMIETAKRLGSLYQSAPRELQDAPLSEKFTPTLLRLAGVTTAEELTEEKLSGIERYFSFLKAHPESSSLALAEVRALYPDASFDETTLLDECYTAWEALKSDTSFKEEIQKILERETQPTAAEAKDLTQLFRRMQSHYFETEQRGILYSIQRGIGSDFSTSPLFDIEISTDYEERLFTALSQMNQTIFKDPSLQAYRFAMLMSEHPEMAYTLFHDNSLLTLEAIDCAETGNRLRQIYDVLTPEGAQEFDKIVGFRSGSLDNLDDLYELFESVFEEKGKELGLKVTPEALLYKLADRGTHIPQTLITRLHDIYVEFDEDKTKQFELAFARASKDQEPSVDVIEQWVDDAYNEVKSTPTEEGTSTVVTTEEDEAAGPPPLLASEEMEGVAREFVSDGKFSANEMDLLTHEYLSQPIAERTREDFLRHLLAAETRRHIAQNYGPVLRSLVNELLIEAEPSVFNGSRDYKESLFFKQPFDRQMQLLEPLIVKKMNESYPKEIFPEAWIRKELGITPEMHPHEVERRVQHLFAVKQLADRLIADESAKLEPEERKYFPETVGAFFECVEGATGMVPQPPGELSSLERANLQRILRWNHDVVKESGYPPRTLMQGVQTYLSAREGDLSTKLFDLTLDLSLELGQREIYAAAFKHHVHHLVEEVMGKPPAGTLEEAAVQELSKKLYSLFSNTERLPTPTSLTYIRNVVEIGCSHVAAGHSPSFVIGQFKTHGQITFDVQKMNQIQKAYSPEHFLGLINALRPEMERTQTHSKYHQFLMEMQEHPSLLFTKLLPEFLKANARSEKEIDAIDNMQREFEAIAPALDELPIAMYFQRLILEHEMGSVEARGKLGIGVAVAANNPEMTFQVVMEQLRSQTGEALEKIEAGEYHTEFTFDKMVNRFLDLVEETRMKKQLESEGIKTNLTGANRFLLKAAPLFGKNTSWSLLGKVMDYFPGVLQFTGSPGQKATSLAIQFMIESVVPREGYQVVGSQEMMVAAAEPLVKLFAHFGHLAAESERREDYEALLKALSQALNASEEEFPERKLELKKQIYVALQALIGEGERFKFPILKAVEAIPEILAEREVRASEE